MITRFKQGSYRWSALAVVLLAVLSCVALTNANSQTQTENKPPTALAKDFVQLLVDNQFAKVTENFDKTMKESLPTDKLAEVWMSTTGQAGLFKQQLGLRTEKFLASNIVFVTCEFEKGPMDIKVVYDSDNKMSGLWFLPVPEDVLKSYRQQSDKQILKKESELRRARLRSKYEQRIEKDKANYTSGQLSEIEQLYQVANKRWNTPEAKQSLVTLIEKYGDGTANRLGCAILYLGQMSQGLEKEKYLKEAVRKHNDSWYGDGVHVAAYARYLLALYYRETGKTKKADNLFKQILRKFPDSVDHRARLLSTFISEQTEKRPAVTRSSRSRLNPQVISTSPVAFAKDISPKLDKITVTFDQKMMNGSYSWTGGGETFPKTTGEPSYDSRMTTCTLPVKLEPGKVYWIGINSPSYKNFKTPDRKPAKRYVILFATKGRDGKPTPIPQNYLEEAKEINERSEQSVPIKSAKPSALQGLIDSAQHGDTVIVPEGVHTEQDLMST